MGQGEPLYNFKNVSQSVKFVNMVFGLAPWRTTISTSGVVPLMPKISSELKAALAVSLHAVDDSLRDHLVPLNKQFPISELMKGVEGYMDGINYPNQQYRITFEYVMLDSVNDSVIEARQLCRLLKKFPAHVNLIPFNFWPNSSFQSSSESTIRKFRDVVVANGIPCHIRTPRGQDIFAACGQLKSSAESKQSSESNNKQENLQ
jgi:23S rRNA (adenine2503-C2)-methyltransferase